MFGLIICLGLCFMGMVAFGLLMHSEYRQSVEKEKELNKYFNKIQIQIDD